jgi:hypothetical protein
MKTVKVTMTRKVTYESELKVSDEDFEIIKDLDYDDVEMYDRSTIKDIGNGLKTISTNTAYEILEGVDDVFNETVREETMFDVTVKEL